nr:hypothetical protein [uncultured Desulfuromonas sp.]
MAKKYQVKDAVFSLRCGMGVLGMTKSNWVDKRLRNFRAGIESNISALTSLRPEPVHLEQIELAKGGRQNGAYSRRNLIYAHISNGNTGDFVGNVLGFSDGN